MESAIEVVTSRLKYHSERGLSPEALENELWSDYRTQDTRSDMSPSPKGAVEAAAKAALFRRVCVLLDGGLTIPETLEWLDS